MKGTIFDLSGRSALVTGGSRGLGKAMARIFAEAGAEVMICGRTDAQLEQTSREIADATGGRVEYEVADMGVRDDVGRLARAAERRLGKVDILVNNAGWNILSPIDEIKDEDWDYLLQLNLTSTMALTRALAPGMKDRRWGRIIYISSILALTSTAARNAYSATKAALTGLAKANAFDLGPYDITANCIAPGPFATEMPMSILSKEQQDTFAKCTALGRWGKPEELAGAALLLASDAGSYITGTTLVVDGGAIAKMF
jgi:NAD(P)-dependent dehydrogenase (short-subunit alcohol dehydrogenase family)